jgi:hypothetical protein
MRTQEKWSGRNSSKSVKRLPWIIIMIAVFALGTTAAVSLRSGQTSNSAPLQNNRQASSTSRSNISLRASSQQLQVNGQTAQIRPLTQEEAQRLAAGIKVLVNQSTDGLQPVRHADGSLSIDLQGHFQNIAVAKRNENGELTQSCVDNPGSAAAFFEIDPALVGAPRQSGSPKVESTIPVKGSDQ